MQSNNGWVRIENADIYVGPLTPQQASYLECGNCGQPICVGDHCLPVQGYCLGVMQTGQLVFVPDPEQTSDNPRYVHYCCTAEYALENITEEPCGRLADDGFLECVGCGSLIELSDYCASCDDKLNRRTG